MKLQVDAVSAATSLETTHRKTGRGQHPNSRANLIGHKAPTWQPGQSGNPAGYPPSGLKMRPALAKYLDMNLNAFMRLDTDGGGVTLAEAVAITLLRRAYLEENRQGDQVREALLQHDDGPRRDGRPMAI